MSEAAVTLLWFLLMLPWIFIQVWVFFDNFKDSKDPTFGLLLYFGSQILAILSLIMITARAYV